MWVCACACACLCACAWCVVFRGVCGFQRGASAGGCAVTAKWRKMGLQKGEMTHEVRWFFRPVHLFFGDHAHSETCFSVKNCASLRQWFASTCTWRKKSGTVLHFFVALHALVSIDLPLVFPLCALFPLCYELQILSATSFFALFYNVL